MIKKFTKIFVSTLALVAMFATAANAYTHTSTLKMGSRNAQVMSLQQTLNMTSCHVAATGAGSPGSETSYFGPATKAAVKCFQSANGLTADGVVGPMSGAALASVMGGGSYPAGCTSNSGYSTTTGQSCAGGSGNLPVGCTSTAGYSPVTGQSCASGGNTGNQTGPVTAMLSSDNPAAGTIVAGQATADLLHITFTGSGTVNSVTLARGGISDQNTLTNVYLYDGVTRLTDGYSYNTNGTITMNNLNLAVNGSRTISVKADVYASTNSYDITTSLTGFTSGNSVNTVNIMGNDMFIATGSGNLATVSLSGSNTVSAATVNAGTSSYAVWRQAFQVNTRNLWLKAANFRVTGSAPSSALSNVSLYIDGVRAGNNAMMTTTNGSSYLSFDMTGAPVSLTTGSHTFEVRADIVGGSSYTVTVSLQQASDLMIMDPQVGVNIAVSSFTASTAGIITIGAGSATIVNDSVFNATTNVTGGSSNVVIAKYKIHGYGEDVKVTSIPVTPVLVNACTTGSTYSSAPCDVTTAGATHTQFATGNGLQNVTLYFNGSQVGSQQSWGSGALTFNLGSQMIIPAGVDSTLEVRADLRTSPASSGAADSTATSGLNYTAGTVSANLGAGTAEGWSSHTSYTTQTVTGHTVAIQAGTLGVSKNGSYASQSVSPNTAGVKIGSYILQNQSTSESVRVTGLTVALTRGDGATALTSTADVSSCPTVGTCYPALTNFSGLRTSESVTPVQPQASNVFSVDFTIAPGSTKTVDVFADTSSATAGIFQTTLVASSLGVTSNVSISQNGNGTAVAGQSITLASGTVTNSSSTPSFLASSSTSAQYLASPNGKTDASKATFNFLSTGGSANITEVKFQVTGTDTVTSVKIGSVTAPVVSGVAWLQGLNLVVPNGGTGLNVDVYMSYSTVGTSGQASVTSGTTSKVTLYSVKYTSGGVTTTLGNGGTAFSSTVLDANTMTMTAATPTVHKQSAPTNVGTGSTSGVKVGTVRITANDGDIKIGAVPVSIGVPTGGTASGWVVKVNGTAPAGITQPTTNTSGFSFASGYQISAGSYVDFDIYVDFAGVTTAGNTDITLGTAGSFTWSDIVDGVLTKTGTLLSTYNI